MSTNDPQTLAIFYRIQNLLLYVTYTRITTNIISHLLYLQKFRQQVPPISTGRHHAPRRWSSRGKWSNSSTASPVKYSAHPGPHTAAYVIIVLVSTYWFRSPLGCWYICCIYLLLLEYWGYLAVNMGSPLIVVCYCGFEIADFFSRVKSWLWSF